MLKKLMKHELRATARLMLPLYLVVLLLAVGARFSVTWLRGSTMGGKALETILAILGSLVTMGFVLALIAVFVVALVLTIQRFRSNLLGDEGYVMFTLPVSTHQLVWSKLIVSTLWFVGAAIVDILAMVILAVNSNFFSDLVEVFPKLLETYNSYAVAHGALVLVEVFLLCVVLSFNLCLRFYAPMAIGHSFDKHKMLLSVVFFFVLETAFQIVGSVLFLVATPLLETVGHALDTAPPEMVLHGGLWFAILATVVYSAVLYVINHLMLSRKLNLE